MEKKLKYKYIASNSIYLDLLDLKEGLIYFNRQINSFKMFKTVLSNAVFVSPVSFLYTSQILRAEEFRDRVLNNTWNFAESQYMYLTLCLSLVWILIGIMFLKDKKKINRRVEDFKEIS